MSPQLSAFFFFRAFGVAFNSAIFLFARFPFREGIDQSLRDTLGSQETL